MHIRTLLAVALLVVSPTLVVGFGISFEGAGPTFLAGRWDAAPRTSGIGGLERSLDGGLRYAFEGGTAQAYIDSFMWSTGQKPTNPSTFIQGLFDVWRSPDPGIGNAFPSQLSFVFDSSVAATDGSVDTGAEIDLISHDYGVATFNGVAFQGTATGGASVVLTSGVTSGTNEYIRGSDVRMNNNSGTMWTQALFGRIFVHEIGHSLGLADVEVAGQNGNFIDDNYTNVATITNTLTNSFSGLIDPNDPEGSVAPGGLSRLTIAAGDFDPTGPQSAPNLFMESGGDNASTALDNDTFAGRQYLYPVAVPEPSAALFMLLVGVGASVRKWFGCRAAVSVTDS